MGSRWSSEARAMFKSDPSGLERSWVQSLLAGDVEGAYQEIAQDPNPSVPTDFAWMILALPMNRYYQKGFRAYLAKYLKKRTPSFKTGLRIVDEFIDSERYVQMRKYEDLYRIQRIVHMDPDPEVEIHYSDEDTCLYDCFYRNS